MEIVALVILLYLGGVFDSSPPAIEEVGGSNVALIYHPSDAQTPNPLLDPKTRFHTNPQYLALSKGGKEPETLDCSTHGRSIISVYDQYQTEIDEQLKKIYSAGQTKISLVLWHSSVNATSLMPNQNKACLSVHTEGLLNSHDAKNLAALVKKIQEIGFTQIHFRFSAVDAPQYYYNKKLRAEVYSYIGPKNRSHSWGTCTPKKHGANVCDPASIAPEWNEKVYQENWNVLYNTRRLILKTLDPAQCQAKSHTDSQPCSGVNTYPRVVFDLGLEYGGSWLGTIVSNVQKNNCQNLYPEIKNDITNVKLVSERGCVNDAALKFAGLQERYASKLWTNYSTNFGNQDTMGFSIVPAYPRYVSSTIEMYDKSVSRQRPRFYGFDVYGDQWADASSRMQSIDKNFALVMRELRAKGEQHKEIFLQETYFNSAEMKRAIRQARDRHGFRPKYVFQWPIHFETDEAGDDRVTDLSPFDQYFP